MLDLLNYNTATFNVTSVGGGIMFKTLYPVSHLGKSSGLFKQAVKLKRKDTLAVIKYLGLA